MGELSFKDMTEEELDCFISRVEDAITYGVSLEGDDLRRLLEAFKACLFLQEKLSKNDLTIRKLQKLLGMVRSSEKLSNILGSSQDREKNSENDSSLDVGPKPPRKGGNGKRSKNDITKKETILVPIEVHSKGDNCPECLSGKLYKYQPTEFVRISGNAPMKAEVYVRSRLRCNLCGKVITAKLPQSVKNDGKDKQRYGYSARSLMAILKYFSGFPFYRQQSLQAVLGVPVTASSTFDQCEALANDISPVANCLSQLAEKASHFHIDDTTHRILDAKPIKKITRGTKTERIRSGIYSSGMIATYNDHDIVLFKTNIGHSGEFIDEILQNRDRGLPAPILMSDALPSNRPTVCEVIWSLCNVHCRRGFVEIAKEFPDECRYVVEIYDKIFDLESKTKDLSPLERLDYHKKHSKPLFDELVSWGKLSLKNRSVEPNSNLGGAIAYLLKHEAGLRKFLEVSGAKLDNNYMERTLKLVVLGRKNSYFFRTQAGAAISDVIMSLASTAHKAGVNIFDYFTDLQRYSKLVKANPEAWMPWLYEATLKSLSPSKVAS